MAAAARRRGGAGGGEQRGLKEELGGGGLEARDRREARPGDSAGSGGERVLRAREGGGLGLGWGRGGWALGEVRGMGLSLRGEGGRGGGVESTWAGDEEVWLAGGRSAARPGPGSM